MTPEIPPASRTSGAGDEPATTGEGVLLRLLGALGVAAEAGL